MQGTFHIAGSQNSDYQTGSVYQYTDRIGAPSNNLRVSRREGQEYESTLINRVNDVYCRPFAFPLNGSARTLHGHNHRRVEPWPNRPPQGNLAQPWSYEDTTCRMSHLMRVISTLQ